jgi:hypothetical protein
VSQQTDDEFLEQIASGIERLWAEEHPPEAPKAPPELPDEPELVTYWRQIIAHRDALCDLITKWETVPFKLGEIPTQRLREMRQHLDALDEEIRTKARWKATDRGHTVAQLRALAAIPIEAERKRKACWVELWLSQKNDSVRPLTAATVRGELGVEELETLERDARDELIGEDQFKQRSKVAHRMVMIAERRSG